MPLSYGETIGDYLAHERTSRGLSQQQVDDAGGPYRQAQSKIEAGEADDDYLRRYLPEYDRAYNWPPGFTETLHRHMAAANGGGSTALPTTTYAGHYHDIAAGNPNYRNHGTVLGFHMDPGPHGQPVGHPVYLEFEENVLTNLPPLQIANLPKSREGLIFIDAAIADLPELPDAYLFNLIEFLNTVQRNHPVDAEAMSTYQIGTTLDHHYFGEAITVDPTAGLDNIESARTLAAGLLAAHPDARTTVNRAAYTLLGIAAYGNNGLRTITDLARNAPQAAAMSGQYQHKPARDFLKYWEETFYNPDHAGPDEAAPDPAVPALFAGILNARATNTAVSIKNPRPSQPAPPPTYEQPTKMHIDGLPDNRCTFITYDSRISPEVPTILTRGRGLAAQQFYAAPGPLKDLDRAPAYATAQTVGYGIGLTDQNDHKVFASRTFGHGTLTHWASNNTAIYCAPHAYSKPIRIYIPNE